MFLFLLFLKLFQAASILLKPDSIALSSVLTNIQICFEIHSSASGYFALGIGSEKMAGADIYGVWLNTSGLANVYRLEGTGHHHPPPRLVQDIQVVRPSTNPDWAKLSAKFCRDLSVTIGNAVTPSTSYIYAWSDHQPKGDIDSERARLKNHHGNYGTFRFDFTKTNDGSVSKLLPIIENPKKARFAVIAFWHALLMFVAWVPAPIVGIFVARYMKKRLTKSWYYIHLAVMGLITGIGSLVGFFLIYSVRRKHFQSSSRIGDLHYKLGLAITIVMVAVQIPLGFLADYYYDPTRKSLPFLDKSHRAVGMILVVVSVFNVWLGIKFSENKHLAFAMPFEVLFFGTLLLGVGLLGFGEIYLHSCHKDEDENEALIAMEGDDCSSE